MRRTLVAAALTALALSVPCGAWWVLGSREAAREAARQIDVPERLGRETATRLAERLGARLEALRAAESRRPFYHYQSLYHDPKGSHDGESVVLSPLAQGPLDPLVRTYFQFDEHGRPSIPEFNLEVPELNRPERVEEERKLLAELAPASVQCRETASEGSARSPSGRGAGPVQAARVSDVQTLPGEDWRQNADATRVYAEIKGRRAASKGASRSPPEGTKTPTPEDAVPQEEVRISTAPLEWRTIPLAGAPTLVALREVTTPAGKLVQGFAVSPGSVADSFEGAAFPVRFLPGESSSSTDARVALGDASWFVSVEASPALVAAREGAREVERRFLATFLVGVALVAVAGLAVVGLVAQSEGLARQRSRFAALAAHELRTPLAGIQMYRDMLAFGLGDPGRHADYARRVADEAARLGRVVANVLGFSRLEQGRLAARPEEGDLGAFVREAVARQEAQLVAAGARVELAVPEALPPARFDRDATAEILSNLLDNAEKYTRGAADRTIRVELAPAAHGLALTVSDRGPGVPRPARLFRPFERGASADAPAGLGLGLALARALARAQGGELRHEARPGGGASFVVDVPLAGR